MALEMRELQGDDLFTMLNIIGKLNIKDDFIALFEGEVAKEAAKDADTAELDERTVGVKMMANLIQTLLLNIGTVKTELNGLFAELTGTDIVTIQTLSFTDYTTLIKDFFKKPELVDFFKSIASLMN